MSCPPLKAKSKKQTNKKRKNKQTKKGFSVFLVLFPLHFSFFLLPISIFFLIFFYIFHFLPFCFFANFFPISMLQFSNNPLESLGALCPPSSTPPVTPFFTFSFFSFFPHFTRLVSNNFPVESLWGHCSPSPPCLLRHGQQFKYRMSSFVCMINQKEACLQIRIAMIIGTHYSGYGSL